ncbi:unnamed protein product [Closterium sp. Naga37s-1]|nr:unnamed protein product [Closterium sp. Naga37s-1]
MSTSLIRSARCTAAEILSMSSQIIHALSSLLLLFRALVALAACRLALTFLLPPLRVVQRIVRFVCLVETWLSAIVRDIEFYGKARDLEHRDEYTENAAYTWSCEGGEQVGCDEWAPWDQLRLSSSSLGVKTSPGRLWDGENMRRWVEEARAVAKLATAAGEEDIVLRRGGEGRSRTIAAGTSGELHSQENDALQHELQQARATCDALRQELEQEWVLNDSLRRELEQERAAADSAAMASMESIRRLQDDKAADQLAARQRERILVEKARYEEEEVEGLRAEVERQGGEILLLREQAAFAGFRYVTNDTDHGYAGTEGDIGDPGGREDEERLGRSEEEEGSERGARIHNIDEDQGSNWGGGVGSVGDIRGLSSWSGLSGMGGLGAVMESDGAQGWSKKRALPDSKELESGLEWGEFSETTAPTARRRIDPLSLAQQEVGAFSAAAVLEAPLAAAVSESPLAAAVLEAPVAVAGDAASLSYALGDFLRPFLPAAKAADAGLLSPMLRAPLLEPAAAGMAIGVDEWRHGRRDVQCELGMTGGKAIEGGMTGGKAIEGGMTGGKAIEGGMTGGKAIEGGMTGGKAIEGGMTGGNAIEGGMTGGKAIEGGMTGGKAIEGGMTGGKAIEGGMTGGKAIEGGMGGGDGGRGRNDG